MPALTTEGKTSTAADLPTSSREPPILEKNSFSVASTLASITGAEQACASSGRWTEANERMAAAMSHPRQIVRMVVCDWNRIRAKIDPKMWRWCHTRWYGQAKESAHENHQSFRHADVGAGSKGEASPHRFGNEGQERRHADTCGNGQRADRHRRRARIAADCGGHRRARACSGGDRRGPDVLRAHLREVVQRLAQHAGARARRGPSR